MRSCRVCTVVDCDCLCPTCEAARNLLALVEAESSGAFDWPYDDEAEMGDEVSDG